MHLTLDVDGTIHQLDVEPTRPLLEVLREELDLTGTKYGYGESECGACTVLVGGGELGVAAPATRAPVNGLCERASMTTLPSRRTGICGPARVWERWPSG